MAKYLLWTCILIVVVLAGVLLWLRYRPHPQVSICSDEVRGYQDTVQSSLSGSEKDLKQVEVSLKGVTSRTYVDHLSRITSTDLLALKACDTQCKLLERCLSQNSGVSVDRGCASEYKDYKTRVDAALSVFSSVVDSEYLPRGKTRKLGFEASMERLFVGA
jgi:hypothetical protein